MYFKQILCKNIQKYNTSQEKDKCFCFFLICLYNQKKNCNFAALLLVHLTEIFSCDGELRRDRFIKT